MGQLNLGRVQGPKGDKGDVGPPGPTGADSTVAGPMGNNVLDQRTGLGLKIWTGTQSQYDAVSPKLNDTIYLIKE